MRRPGRSAAPSGVDDIDLGELLEKLFERYEMLDHPLKFAMFFFLAASFALAVLGKNARARSAMLPVLSFLFFATFSIRSLNPLRVWMSNEVRYMIVILPLVMAINCAFAVTLLKHARDHWGKKWFLPFHTHFAGAWAAAICLLVGYLYYEEHGPRAFRAGNVLDRHQTRQERFSDAFERGLPIVQKRSKHKKALRLVWSMYLSEGLITKKGELLSFEPNAKALDKRHDWISKDRRGYKRDAKRMLRRDKRCLYMVRLRGRYLKQYPSGPLRKSCKAKASKTKSKASKRKSKRSR